MRGKRWGRGGMFCRELWPCCGVSPSPAGRAGVGVWGRCPSSSAGCPTGCASFLGSTKWVASSNRYVSSPSPGGSQADVRGQAPSEGSQGASFSVSSTSSGAWRSVASWSWGSTTPVSACVARCHPLPVCLPTRGIPSLLHCKRTAC